MNVTILNKAKEVKNDEFYTRYEDIEFLLNFKDQFKDKVIYCNCDDPSFSNFYKFFKINFTKLGLKRLISTYKSDNPYRYDYDGINEIKTPIESGLFEYNSDIINEYKDDIIVITNPPFSLMRLYINFIMNLNVKFMIIAPTTIIGVKIFFEYFRENKIKVIPSQRIKKFINSDKESNCCWITNLNSTHLNTTKIKFTNTNIDYYKKLFGTDIIIIDSINNIPDYKGLMALSLNLFYTYDYSCFEIIDSFNNIKFDYKYSNITQVLDNKHKKSTYFNKNPMIEIDLDYIKNNNPKRYFIVEIDGKMRYFKKPFDKIIVKRKDI